MDYVKADDYKYLKEDLSKKKTQNETLQNNNILLQTRLD